MGTAEPGRVDRPTAVEAVRSLARAARFFERAAGDLGMAQYRVLSAIAAGDERASRVAERFGLGRPSVSAVVDSLCRAGLVVRADSAGDHRATDLSLSAEGRAHLERVEDAMVEVLERLTERSGTGKAVRDALASLGPAIDSLRADRSVRLRSARS